MKSLVKGGVTATLSLLLTSFVAETAFALTVEKQRVLSPNSQTNNTRYLALNDTVEILEAQVGLAIPKTESIQERSLFTKLVKEKIQPTSRSVNRENAEALSTIARILPDNTPLVGLVNLKAGATLGRFQLFPTIGKAMSAFLPASLNFNYLKDIGSWSGDQVAIAFLPKVDSAPATLDSGSVMLATVKDEMRLQSYLSKLKANPQRVIERQYKGVNILEIKPPSTPSTKQPDPIQTKLSSISKPKFPQRPQSWVVATLPGYVVTGNNTKAVEQLIDTYSGGTATLAQNPRFQKTVEHQQAGQVLFTLYENLETFLPLTQDLAKDPSMPFPLVGLSAINAGQLKEFGSLDGIVTLQPEGLRFQVNAYRQEPKPNTVELEPGTILSRMPAATYTAFTGRHLNQKWQSIAQVLSFQPKYKNNLAKFRQEVRSKTGLDLDRDILGWMDGEYGLFMFPTQGGVFNTAPAKYNVGLGLAVQTSDRAAADNTTKKLEAYINATNSFLTVNTRTIKGHSVTSWDFKGTTAPSLVAYSWVDNNTLILTSGLGALTDLVPQPQVLLPLTYNFTTATNSLPHANHGYFYMNMGSFLSWVYGFIPAKYNNQGLDTFKQAIGSIYSISSTSSTTADREQFDFLVVLAPVRKQK